MGRKEKRDRVLRAAVAAAQAAPEPWTPFEEAARVRAYGVDLPLTPALRRELGADRLYRNSRYTVFWRDVGTNEAAGRMVHLSIKRNDRLPIHDWRDLQRIKTELCGPEAEGVELYPAESRRVDSANQYHLWVLLDSRWPIGFTERLVRDETQDHDSAPGAVQRPFEEDVARTPDAEVEDLVRRRTAADIDAAKRREAP
jgi:hypothetical protein